MTATVRHDFEAIAEWIKPGSRVLDLGCGDGALLAYLAEGRQIAGYGVEISSEGVLASVKRGINVLQMNLEDGLSIFETTSFDYVILSRTLQAMHNTEGILQEMLRVGRQGIVTFPNFGYWRNRLQVLAGRMPVSAEIPYQWFDTPNIHLCTLNDFEELCKEVGARILQRVVMANGTDIHMLHNLLGSLAVYRFENEA
ncbi:MAG TPA: methionine biosynthesis protein MetW [Thiobacillaceae bacterium]|nr:methionine biosynthesis protein MetW [Thiobacillaceae bacterium]